MSWGKSLIIDCYGCNPTAIRSSTIIRKFVKELVEVIDMQAYGEPQIIHFGSGNKEGYTLVQLIETSNITAHFANDSNAAFFDVFSCKDFSEETVMAIIDKYFGSADFTVQFGIIERGEKI